MTHRLGGSPLRGWLAVAGVFPRVGCRAASPRVGAVVTTWPEEGGVMRPPAAKPRADEAATVRRCAALPGVAVEWVVVF